MFSSHGVHLTNAMYHQARIIEINCMDGNYFLCDRVCAQSKKLKKDILVAFDQEKCGLENGIWLSGYRSENILHSIRLSVQCTCESYTQMQCIQAKTM